MAWSPGTPVEMIPVLTYIEGPELWHIHKKSEGLKIFWFAMQSALGRMWCMMGRVCRVLIALLFRSFCQIWNWVFFGTFWP
jgi:hypothetical protein